jgi:hypothetical protein
LSSQFRKGLFVVGLAFATATLSGQVVEPGRPQRPTPIAKELPLTQKQQLGDAPVFKLSPLDDSVRDLPSPRHGVARVGVRRALASSVLGQGAWQSAADGAGVWRLSLESENAVALRVHFVNFNVGAGKVWIHDTANQQTYGPYTGLGRFEDGRFWTEAIFGDSIEVEYVPAAGRASSGAPPFQMPEISHLYRVAGMVSPRPASSQRTATSRRRTISQSSASSSLSAATPGAGLDPAPTSGGTTCFLDASCYFTGANATEYPAVPLVHGSMAFLLFSDSSGEYQCSGQMLNAPNGKPILLTAGHCINSPATLESLTAAFDYNPSTCGGVPPNPFNLTQITGASLLSYSDLPFETINSESDIVNDLDYSLVLMSGFPDTPDFTLAGYSTFELAFGQKVTSLSYPIGRSLQFAYAPRVDSTTVDTAPSNLYPGYWANAYQIEYNTIGRIDDGSSGSGIFDNQGHLLGTLSTGVADCNNPNPVTGACPIGSTACDVTGPYDNWYNKFSATYEQVRDYLEQPILGPLASNSAEFSASPNPIYTSNLYGLGQTTLTFKAPITVTNIEIRIGSPDGRLLGSADNSGTAKTGPWVTNGMVFYLQNVTGGLPLTAGNTIATVTAQVIESATGGAPVGTLTANPSTVVVPNGSYLGQTTLNWTAPGASLVQLRIGSPTGTLFAEAGSTASATTGDWVSDGMTFYLVNVSNGPASAADVLASAVVHVDVDGGSTVSPGTVSFFLDPDPIMVSSGQYLGTATLHWNTGGLSPAQIRVGSPTGTVFANDISATGTAQTGSWVSNGLLFYLEDMSGTVLATATANLVASTINLGNTQFTVANNPILVPIGAAATANVAWSTAVSSDVEIHSGAPWGPLVASGGSSGAAAIPNVVDGLTLYLQNRSGDLNPTGAFYPGDPTPPPSYGQLPLELQYTLATATVHVVSL